MKQKEYRLPTLKSRLHPSRQPGTVKVHAPVVRKSAYERGYDARWRAYRLEFLGRNPFCMMRGEGCTLVATVVDHIKRHGGDTILFWDKNNHQSLCDHCHNVHKQRQEHAERYHR